MIRQLGTQRARLQNLTANNPTKEGVSRGTTVAAIAAAILVASATLATAHAGSRSNYNEYYPSYVICDPYAGTYWDGVAPYASQPDECDPYYWTYWYGVVPY